MVKGLTLTIGMLCSFASVGYADFNISERLNFRKTCDAAPCVATPCPESACSFLPAEPASCDGTSCDGADSKGCFSGFGKGLFSSFGKGCLSCDGGECGCDSKSCGGCQACCKTNPCCRYWSFFGGWSSLENYVGEDANFDREGTFKDGFVLGGARGRILGNHLRHEFEFAYRHNQGDQWSSVPNQQARNFGLWTGDVNAFSGMSNLIYDFGNRDQQKVTPYVGGGVGFAFVNATLNSQFSQFLFDDSAFAYQGFAGASMKCRKNARLFTEYRFFGTDQINLQSGGGWIGESSYLSHNVISGIQFRR